MKTWVLKREAWIIWPAIAGSLFVVVVFLFLAAQIGVAQIGDGGHGLSGIGGMFESEAFMSLFVSMVILTALLWGGVILIVVMKGAARFQRGDNIGAGGVGGA